MLLFASFLWTKKYSFVHRPPAFYNSASPPGPQFQESSPHPQHVYSSGSSPGPGPNMSQGHNSPVIHPGSPGHCPGLPVPQSPPLLPGPQELWALTVKPEYLVNRIRLWHHQIWVVLTTARAFQNTWWKYLERITALQAHRTHLVKGNSVPAMSPYKIPLSFMIITIHSMLSIIFSHPVTLVVSLPF